MDITEAIKPEYKNDMKKDIIHRNLLSKKEREDFRKTEVYKDSLYWWYKNKYNSPNKVAFIMNLIHEYWYKSEQRGYIGWVKFYTKTISYDEIYKMIMKIQKEQKISIKDATNIWWIHILDYAWDGLENELQAKKYLQQYCDLRGQGYRAQLATGGWNTYYGIDLFVLDPSVDLSDPDSGSNIIIAVQVKNSSYFLKAYDKDRKLYDDRKRKAYTDRYKSKIWIIDIEATVKNDELVWHLSDNIQR